MKHLPLPRSTSPLTGWVPTLALAGAVFFSACSSTGKKAEATAATTGTEKTVVTVEGEDQNWEADEDWDAVEAVAVHDPIEAFNRATFLLNHGIYAVVVRPISKTYTTIVPKPLRTGIYNAYENVRFPVRFVNHSLQGRFDRAGTETGKFLVDSTLGIGGILQASQWFPALKDLPPTDTGTTLAKYGIGHGPYLVIPLIGPSTGRELFGLIGDAALNPVTWVSFMFGGAVWTMAISTPNTLRSLPEQMDTYDAVTRDAVDRYIAARNAYIQYRNARVER